MDPVSNPTAYDSFWLAGQKSPGVCRMGEPQRDEGWSIAQAKGSDGAEITHDGAKLLVFSVEIYLWRDANRDCFAEWTDFRPVLLPPTKDGPGQLALDIYHPVLDGIGVTSVVVSKRTEPIPDGKGGATVKLEFTEYRPSKKRTGSGKPKGSKANTSTVFSDFFASGGGGGGASGVGVGGGFGSAGGSGPQGTPRERQPRPETNVDKKAQLAAALEENKRVHNQ